jgi:hypothetical protein
LVWAQFEHELELGKYVEVCRFVRSEPAAKFSARLKQLVGKKRCVGEKYFGWRDESKFLVQPESSSQRTAKLVE